MSDIQTVYEERAAIREYDGGFDRTEAERLAWDDLRGLGFPQAEIDGLRVSFDTA
jgi:hypothetical protein